MNKKTQQKHVDNLSILICCGNALRIEPMPVYGFYSLRWSTDEMISIDSMAHGLNRSKKF